MAVQNYTIEAPPAGDGYPEGTRVVTWSLNSGDTGLPYRAAHRTDKSVQVTGTAGAGTTVRMEGTNNATGASEAYGILNAPNMTPASWNDADITASKILQILENTWTIRPNYTAGSATSVVVRMLITTTARR